MERGVFISGGAGGIGGACARWFRDRGDAVVVFDRTNGQDACDPLQVQAALQSLARVDVVIHAAGSVGAGGIEDCTVEEWRRVFEDNLTSAFVVCQAALPLMSSGGSIVLFSSVNGRHGGNRLSGPAYAAAKAGIIGLTRHLAKDQAGRGIRVNALAPGPVATEMLARLSAAQLEALRASMPLGDITAVDEIAEAAGWLSSPVAASVTGVVLDVNAGMWMG